MKSKIESLEKFTRLGIESEVRIIVKETLSDPAGVSEDAYYAILRLVRTVFGTDTMDDLSMDTMERDGRFYYKPGRGGGA